MGTLWLETVLIGNIVHGVEFTIWASVLVCSGNLESFLFSSNIVQMSGFRAGLAITSFNAAEKREIKLEHKLCNSNELIILSRAIEAHRYYH